MVSGNSVTVEWQGTGPDPNNRVQNFLCSLDGGEGSSCTSAILYMIMYYFLCIIISTNTIIALILVC